MSGRAGNVKSRSLLTRLYSIFLRPAQTVGYRERRFTKCIVAKPQWAFGTSASVRNVITERTLNALSQWYESNARPDYEKVHRSLYSELRALWKNFLLRQNVFHMYVQMIL